MPQLSKAQVHTSKYSEIYQKDNKIKNDYGSTNIYMDKIASIAGQVSECAQDVNTNYALSNFYADSKIIQGQKYENGQPLQHQIQILVQKAVSVLQQINRTANKQCVCHNRQ